MKINLYNLYAGFLHISLACLLIIGTVHGQDNRFNEIVPPSPNAASLGKYGEIPVSYHTGVPQISIPIHTVKEGDISVPISLSYHASGIKLEEISSWVGIGWSVNAGGVITRSVVGAPDEGSSRGGISDVAQVGWYKDGGLDPRFEDAACPNPNSTDPGFPQAGCLYRFSDAASGVADTEPDIFSFNVAGYSGKFFFNEYQEVVMQPKQDIEIKPSPDFATWTITTPDGTKYSFGGAAATELSYFGPTGGCCNDEDISSTSWYLTKIENFNATRWIAFNYVPEKYSYTMRPGQSVSLTSGGVPPPGSAVPTAQFFTYAPEYASLVSIKGLRLATITSSSGFETIAFEAETLRQDVSKYASPPFDTDEAKRLDRIVITNDQTEKTFEFGYSYFVSETSSSYPGFAETQQDRYRLRLDYLLESTDQESKQPHQFFYNTEVTMARRLSLARDHWGYYNGADGNTGLLPSFSVVGHDYNGLADRDVDETKMQAFNIKKIVYPTGGYTEFYFEAHQQGPNSPVGGLRIKQIKTFDGINSLPMVKDYGYDYGYLYAGNPNYVQTTAQHEYSGYPLPDLGILVTSNIRAALRTTQGYHIGYSTVWVTDGQNGKSTYRFFNSIPGFDSYFPASPTQAELGMGELFQEVHQDQNGAVLHSITNRYISDFTRTIRAKKVTFLSCVDGCGSCGLGENLCNQYAMVRNYEIKEGRRLLLEREEYKDGVTTRTNYSYSPNHNNPTRVSTKQSDGREQVADYEFIKDQYVSGCTINDSDCRQTYLNTVQSLRQQLAASIGACESFAASSCESQQEWTAGDCQFSSDWDEPLAGCQSACELRKRGECIEANGLLAIYQAGIKNAETEYLSCRALVVQTYDGCVQSSLASLNASDKVLATMIVGNWNGALEESTLMDESQIAGTKTHFDFQNNLLLPTDFEMYDTQLQDWSHEYSVLYDNKANIVQTKKRQDRSVAYLWGYKQTLPIAKIENCELMAEEEATPTSYTIPTVSVPGLQTDPLTIASNIDIPFDQDVTFDLSLSKEYADPSIPDSYFNVSIFLVNQTSQSQVYAGGFGLTTQTTHVISNVPAGKYLVQYQYLGDIGVDNTFTFNASLTYQANNRFANSYFTSFEEDVTNTTADAYTGRKSHVGTFTFNLPKQIGDYVLSYRTKDGSGAWIAHSETITVTTTESTMHTIGSAGQFLDEVRLYPTYSKMTTYTYDPSIGLTSMTDPNDLTSYFEYDELGRLVVVRDSDRNIIKHYKYHYQGQE